MIVSDDECCQYLICAFSGVFHDLKIIGGAGEPFYLAPKENKDAIIYFRSNYPRSLLHEVSHYCLAGDRRRRIDDFGFWYSPCGRTAEEQSRFEIVEARPQGLEKAMCEIVGLRFSPSLDDFSGSPPSEDFLKNMDVAYREMMTNPPPTAKKALFELKKYANANGPLMLV
ncbi:elongation factor P hydroxylase [Pseudidiomarina sp.]|uniref:elongation factor P hydroxylase n=1 Tax=Pseudomonadota TaxID=1224 RepID=UPI003A975274